MCLSLSLLNLIIPAIVADPGTCRDTTGWLRADARPDGTPPAARGLETWLALTPDLDAPLLTPDAIDTLNTRNMATLGAWQDPLGDAGPRPTSTEAELSERLDVVSTRIASGEYVTDPPPPRGEPFDFVRARLAQSRILASPRLQGVVDPAPLRCLPLDAGFFRGKIDPAFDRNQCSRLDPGDLIRVERETSDGWLYVRAGHGVGWLHLPWLSPPLSPMRARALREGPTLVVTGDLVPAETTHGALVFLRTGRRLPLVAADAAHFQVLVPRLEGWEDAFVPRDEAVSVGLLPLTRRHVLTLAFARLNDPYGWGGLGGFRDCSALLLDLMSAFGLELGRNSSVQGRAGTTVRELEGLSEYDKLAAIREAHAAGIVFLYMQGHIMLYLGQFDGRDYALSAISEYLMPCPEGGHRTVRIDRVDVTDLERGRDTERTSFLTRITRLSLFGAAPR
jgi:hypothetical protein